MWRSVDTEHRTYPPACTRAADRLLLLCAVLDSWMRGTTQAPPTRRSSPSPQNAEECPANSWCSVNAGARGGRRMAPETLSSRSRNSSYLILNTWHLTQSPHIWLIYSWG